MNEERKEKLNGIARSGVGIFLCFILFFSALFGVLGLGCVYTKNSWDFWSPDYEKMDISAILEKTELSNSDYEILYNQTGLTRLAIDDYITAQQQTEILRTQAFFFRKHKVSPERIAPFSYIEYIEEYSPMAILKDGDILVTATTRVSWFRYGHAALVVDGNNGVILESFAPGQNSSLGYSLAFSDLANFIVLRPKTSDSVKAQVVEYAKSYMLDLPYSMTTGVFSKKFPDKIEKTQCAHLVWYAYKKFGLDLDSTGGGVVKPRDIANSDKVEVVQAFGFNPKNLWR